MPIWIKSLVMGGCVYGSINLCTIPVFQLIIGIFTGIISYIGISLMTKDQSFWLLVRLVKSKIRKH